MASNQKVFVSPGVYTSEVDLSFVAQSVGVTTLGIVGETLKGPAFEPIFIRNFDEFTNFGFLFQHQEDENYDCWTFDFNIQHTSVFNDGINELGALYSDCDTVPMIKTDTAWNKLPAFLDTSDELKNIYFKVVKYE